MTTKPVSSYIFIIYIIFILALANGYLMAIAHPDQSRQSIDQLFSGFGFAHDISTFQLFVYIFLNNSVKAFLVVLFGFFFGIVPIFFVFSNANVIGLVLAVFGAREGFLKVVLSLLPHGILEIPAILMASGYGLWLGVRFFRKLRYGEPFGEAFRFAMRKYFTVVFPLLLLAAFIEAYITTFLMRA
ncbi:MAG TPA: stage II sporulation protein M [Candidatus Bathyarchaeia archaeon]|nr:stage II sporulation protein M [Candidatus Bathyarchaeia archaeon]